MAFYKKRASTSRWRQTSKKRNTYRGRYTKRAKAPRVVVVQAPTPKKDSSKVIITADAEQTVYVQGPEAAQSYVRIPISAAIPTQQQAGAGPDDRNRTSNKIRIKGIRLRAWISTTATTRIMALVYENRHQNSVVGLVGTPPHAFKWGVKVASTTTTATTTSNQRRMLTAIEAGMLSVHGPFATKHVANYMHSLDSTDGTLFTADLSKTSGKAIGSWSWTQDGSKVSRKRRFALKKDMGLMRTVNWTQQSNDQVGDGWIQSEGESIDAYCEINWNVETASEITRDLRNTGELEMMLGGICRPLEMHSGERRWLEFLEESPVPTRGMIPSSKNRHLVLVTLAVHHKCMRGTCTSLALAVRHLIHHHSVGTVAANKRQAPHDPSGQGDGRRE
ncbi:hypothetical protein C7212DRAFT_361390 [Tuber magnatum]|uniref:Uncharacterized protein n=1 Tax=Tuber magnatum TaxID=42249 RepID=A0A317SZM7_9PEZI|nr:hypothetical protein C7212DRAFT_361390 [Tuber magnatum]